jgi:hypothetical protein
VQPLHYYSTVPIVIRFRNCAIYINTSDHNPPHFHIRIRPGSVVAIETMELLSSSIPKREITEPLAWAKDNQALLLEKFKEFNP